MASEYAHVQPVSIVQVEEQPSPLFVFKSSHPSPIVSIPSPQVYVHVDAEVVVPPVQLHPDTGPVQSALHPSLLFKFPSSQTSVNIFFPSPQIAVQVFGDTPVLHVHPASTVQVELHPSPLVGLPSSHVSLVVHVPSPQT